MVRGFANRILSYGGGISTSATRRRKMSEDAPPPHNGPAREGEETGEKTTSIRIASYNIRNGRAGGWRRLYALWCRQMWTWAFFRKRS
eukprot:scaffold25751_cov57-Attheya_sp.AAC.3